MISMPAGLKYRPKAKIKEDDFLPELPEVEITTRGIQPYLEGASIVSVLVRNPNLRWPVSPEINNISGQQVLTVHRRAKYIIITLEKGSILTHLGMSGRLRVLTEQEPMLKHDHIEMALDSGNLIRFNDPRRFGCWLWTTDWPNHKLIKHLGPEPLTKAFSADYLYAVARTRSTSIKQLIMNSRVLAGVGNIYANEALFLARIHPKRAANRISKKRLGTLVDNIRAVLGAAINQGGTTLQDFVGSDGNPGHFKQQLFVYGRQGQTCKCCAKELMAIRQSGRSTVYCRHCQK
jgi:formamidopyrimidine-DNA glycosylase